MKKYENFCASFANLNDIFSYEEPYNNVVLTGLVALYEICFEQSWKMMKELLEDSGVAEGRTGSPRQILKAAYQAGMIREEELWLDALVSGGIIEDDKNVTELTVSKSYGDAEKVSCTIYYEAEDEEALNG